MEGLIVWSGPIGGIAVGLYMLSQFLFTGQALGASTGYGNVCALISRNEFFHTGSYVNPWSWRMWFTLGIPLGGLAAVLTSPTEWALTWEMGTAYEAMLPASPWARVPLLFGGGVAIGYGARLAGGCQSGHAITGMSMLNPPSMAAGAGMFVGGIVMVQTLAALAGYVP